jgi:hypothetical protein
LEKIIAWVIKFKEVGDLAVQYDPIHAALPWAGVRFFLQVNDSLVRTESQNLRLPFLDYSTLLKVQDKVVPSQLIMILEG